MRIALLSPNPLDVHATTRALTDPRVGALATFTGLVRNHDPAVTGEVAGLEYSAHPDAARALERLVAECTSDASIHGVAAEHRIGYVAVGETALVVAVAAEHRAPAQELCRDLVESIKATLPVWKKEVLVDGSHTWVGWAS